MKAAIATVCISGGSQEKLEAAGFVAVKIFENDLIAYPGSPADIRQLCADLGLRIVTCQPFHDCEGTPADKRQRTFDRAERKFDLLQELGTDLLFVCSSVAPDAQGGIDRLAADFRELGEHANQRGLRVGFEALAWGRSSIVSTKHLNSRAGQMLISCCPKSRSRGARLIGIQRKRALHATPQCHKDNSRTRQERP